MSLKNERVQFYLRHREQLEEWFELRTEAAQAIDAWLAALASEIESLADEMGSDVQLVNNTDGVTPTIYLRKRSWPVATTDEQPRVGLEWARKLMLKGESFPYVGIRSDRKTEIGRVLAEDAGFQAERKRLKYSTTALFPAYRYVIPTRNLAEGEDEYKALLLDSIREIWTSFAPFIDAAVQRLRPEP